MTSWHKSCGRATFHWLKVIASSTILCTKTIKAPSSLPQEGWLIYHAVRSISTDTSSSFLIESKKVRWKYIIASPIWWLVIFLQNLFKEVSSWRWGKSSWTNFKVHWWRSHHSRSVKELQECVEQWFVKIQRYEICKINDSWILRLMTRSSC